MDSKETSGGVPDHFVLPFKMDLWYVYVLVLHLPLKHLVMTPASDWIQCRYDDFCVSMVICSFIRVPVVFMEGLLLASLWVLIVSIQDWVNATLKVTFRLKVKWWTARVTEEKPRKSVGREFALSQPMSGPFWFTYYKDDRDIDMSRHLLERQHGRA